MAILLELPDSGAAALLKGYADDNTELRTKNAELSAKIADLISLIVSSRASTARLTRCSASGLSMSGMAPCSDIPVA